MVILQIFSSFQEQQEQKIALPVIVDSGKQMDTEVP